MWGAYSPLKRLAASVGPLGLGVKGLGWCRTRVGIGEVGLWMWGVGVATVVAWAGLAWLSGGWGGSAGLLVIGCRGPCLER